MLNKNLTQEEFDKLVAEKEHEQFMEVMRKLLKAVEGMNDTSDVEMSLNNLNLTLSTLLNSGVKLNSEALIKAIKEANPPKEIKKKNNDDIEQWTFTVNRDSNGFIQSVTAIKF